MAAHVNAPEALAPAGGRLELPGGVLGTDGICHKMVWVRELTGRDEEILCDRRYASGAKQVSALLARAIERIEGLAGAPDAEQVDEMLVGDRDYLVLRLRQLALGDRVHQVMRCPSLDCGCKVDVEFEIGELPLRRLERVESRYAVELSRPAFADDPTSRHVVVRLPNGRDQEAVAALGAVSPGEANTRLLSRVVLEAGRRSGLDEAAARELPLAVRRELVAFLREAAPGPELAIEVQCPECGGELAYDFDLHSFFLTSGT